MTNILRQNFFIPQPSLTEKNLPDQHSRVHIVTGGYAGVGLELAKILYQKNATVYVAGRSEEKATKAIATIKELFPDSKGKVEFLKIDLSDFATIKPAVEDFKSRESRLDVLTNNAGVMVPPVGSTDAHGHELQLGTNCLGPFLFTKLLTPLLLKTAKDSPPGSVRVTWASSIAATLMGPKGGASFEEDGTVTSFLNDKQKAYGQSKSLNCLLAAEYAERYGQDGIISVSWNPGNLSSELARHMPWIQVKLLQTFLLYPTIYGAYTELFAGCSTDITAEHNGAYIAPWGRIVPLRNDIELGMKRTSAGGTGQAERFWAYCEKETAQYN